MVFQLLACSRHSDSRAREKNSRRKKKNEGRLSRSCLPPPSVFPVYNLLAPNLPPRFTIWTPGTGYPVIGNVTPRGDNIRVRDAWRLPKNVCVGCWYPGTRLSRNWTKRKLPFRYNSIFLFFRINDYESCAEMLLDTLGDEIVNMCDKKDR